MMLSLRVASALRMRTSSVITRMMRPMTTEAGGKGGDATGKGDAKVEASNTSAGDLNKFTRAGELAVSIINGRPAFTMPLPTLGTTVFTFNTAQPVWRFLKDIKAEDKNIRHVKVFTPQGEAYADSTPIGTILQDKFQLSLDNNLFTISPSAEVMQDAKKAMAPELRELVLELHAALHSREATKAKINDVEVALNALKLELEPLEAKRQQCEAHSKSVTTAYIWGGLAYMCFQWGTLARLTWWEYSWDIMEPVTYFIGSATSIIFAAYFVLTRTEFGYELHGERKHLQVLHKRAKKVGLDVVQYNKIQSAIYDKEAELRTLYQRL